MKTYIQLVILSHLLALLFISCEKTTFNPNIIDPKPKPPIIEDTTLTHNKFVAKWILSEMEDSYLWSNKIPSVIDMTKDPEKFFKTILYEEEDRFSKIIKADNDTINNSSELPKTGYDYTLLSTVGSQDIYGFINFVIKGSPAESAGLKRGDLFIKINGTQLTRSNYAELTKQTTSIHSLTMAKIDSDNNFIADKNIIISVSYFYENPILVDTMYHINGKSIGYLTYNSFDKNSSNLNIVFDKFKNENITDLVLDLRYNGGGELSSAINLASLILGPSYENKIFTKRTYNDNLQAKLLTEYGEEYFIDRFKSTVNGLPVHHLGIKKLYILISYRTSSASELIINGLKPYIDIVLIGRNPTMGINVGSMHIAPNDYQISWQLIPVVVRISNSNDDSNYSSGFDPNIWKNEYEIRNTKELGNIHEALLSEAIFQITGVTTNTTHQPYYKTIIKPIISSKEILYPNKHRLHINPIPFSMF